MKRLILLLLILCFSSCIEQQKSIDSENGFLLNSYMMDNNLFDYLVKFNAEDETVNVTLKNNQITFYAYPDYPLNFRINQKENVRILITDNFGQKEVSGTLEYRDNLIIIEYLNQTKQFNRI